MPARAVADAAAATRSRISPAALLVNVIARIWLGHASRLCAAGSAMRCVSTRVLPEPAPATMSSAWPAVLDRLALLGVEPVGEAGAGCRAGTAGGGRGRLAPAGRVVGVEDQRHVPSSLGAASDTGPRRRMPPCIPDQPQEARASTPRSGWSTKTPSTPVRDDLRELAEPVAARRTRRAAPEARREEAVLGAERPGEDEQPGRVRARPRVRRRRAARAAARRRTPCRTSSSAPCRR